MKKQQHEITDGDISFVSFVRKGANRSPFKIRKSDEESVFMKNLRKASYQPPQTRAEEDADTAEKAERRAEVANRRVWEAEQTALRREAQFIAERQTPLSPSERARLKEMETRIAVLDSLIWDGGPIVKHEIDQFDLMMMGVSPAHAARGGRSQTISANLPAEISKGGDAQFEADLASDALGVRRRPANVQKGDDELLSNSLGLRTQRTQR
jgi:hypothetical protein